MGSDIWPPGSVMVGAIILALIYGYLFFAYRYQYLAFWSAAWGTYAVPALINAGMLPLPIVFLNIFSIIATFFLAYGLLMYLKIRFPRADRFKKFLFYSAVAALLLLIINNLVGLSNDWQLAFTYIYLFAFFGGMGAVLLFNVKKGGFPYAALGLPVFLIGLGAFTAIFVLPDRVETVLLLVLGISIPVLAITMLISFVDHLRQDILESQRQARIEIEEALNETQRNYQSVVEQQTVGVGIVDTKDRFVFANPAADIIFGVEPGGLIGRSLIDFVVPEDTILMESETEKRRKGISSVYEISIRQPNGDIRVFSINASARFNRYGDFTGTLGVFMDLTDRKKAEAEVLRLLELERYYRRQAETLQEATKDLVIALDLDQVLERVLTNLQNVIPYDSACLFLYNEENLLQAVAGKGFSSPESFLGQELTNNPLASMIMEKRSPLVLRDAQQEMMYIHWGEASHVHGWMGVPLIWHENAIGILTIDSCEVGAYTEGQSKVAQAFANQAAVAIQNSRLFERVEKMAVTDPLTGISNRRYLFERAQLEFARFLRYGTSLAVVMMDIDHFNHVNNTYGHFVGDKVLQEIARRLQTCIREVDIIGRYGGEEFLIVLTEPTPDSAYAAAERLRSVICEQPVQVEHHQVNVTVSVGVSMADDHCPDLDCLIIRADNALYQAKADGRNRVVLWQPER